MTWTSTEDLTLLGLVDAMLPTRRRDWASLRVHFPTRSTSSLRNRYQRITAEHPVGKHRCRACGMSRRGHICQSRLLTSSSEPIDKADADAVVTMQQLFDVHPHLEGELEGFAWHMEEDYLGLESPKK